MEQFVLSRNLSDRDFKFDIPSKKIKVNGLLDDVRIQGSKIVYDVSGKDKPLEIDLTSVFEQLDNKLTTITVKAGKKLGLSFKDGTETEIDVKELVKIDTKSNNLLKLVGDGSVDAPLEAQLQISAQPHNALVQKDDGLHVTNLLETLRLRDAFNDDIMFE